MTEVSSVAAVILAIVMLYAAQSKLRAHEATSRDFQQLGLPQPAVVAWLVPLAEIAIAVALVATPGWGGVAAFIMLIGFTTFLVSILRSGAQVSCACFGSTNNEPVSVVEVGRNLILLTLAAASASIERLVQPTLASVMVVSIAALIGLTLVQLISLRTVIGPLFHIELAGEAGLAEQPERETPETVS